MSQHKINRRKFLQMSAAGAAGLVLASCAAPAAPTQAPAQVEPTKPPAAAATPTPIPTQAATATPVPTLATSTYKEAPNLPAGLPPVDERLPVNPLVLAPINAIGKYGGRIRTIGGWEGFNSESQYGHSPLRWIDDGLGIAPGTVDVWETNANNTEWTFHMRQGLKWSDGQPCTVDDVMFWWEDMVNANYEGAPDSPPDFGTAGGQLAKFEKMDDFTVKITYAEPAPLTAKRLAMWVNANIGPRWIAPKHYLQQYHPKYNTAVKDFEEFNKFCNVHNNPAMPSLNAWVVTEFVAAQSIKLDRNPYYYAVDTEGNQLPYIDGIDFQYVSDREVQLVQVLQGSVDYLHFHGFTLGDVGTLKDNETKGNYDTYLWDSGSGTGQMYFWNYDVADDKKREIFRNPKYKAAVSHAMDRARIQRTVYYNTGILTTGTMSPKAIEFNFNAEAQERYKKYRDAYVAYDPAKSEALLDEIGMKKGADGFRTYPDGTPFEFRIDIHADAGKEATDVMQVLAENWKAVGFNVVINQVPPSDFDNQWRTGKLDFRTNWEVGDGPDHLLYPSWVVPNEQSRWAPLCGKMLELQGTPDDQKDCDTSPWERTPPRFCKTDAAYAGTPVETLQNMYEKAKIEVDDLKRNMMVWDMLDIHYEQIFYLGTVANYPRIIIVGKNLDNVPKKEQLKLGGFVNPWIIPYPAVVNTETYYFKNV